MSVRKRRGQITRLIDVPICSACSHELQLKSGDEERWQRLGLLATVSGGLFFFVISLLLIPGVLPFWLRIIAALTTAILVGFGLSVLFKRKSLEAARPEKKAILDSVQMVNFSWRATTFEFDNETFARGFRELNESGLMEISS